MAKRSQLKLAKKDLQNQNPDLILLWKTTTSKSLCGAMFIRTPSVTPSQKCEKLFTNWGNARNVTFSESPIPDDILASEQKENLWMAMPVRHRDKEEYGPPYHRKTSHHLLGSRGISDRAPINFLTNAEFLQLRNLLDSLYGKLHASGVGTSTKRMPALTAEDEDKLLTSKVLNPEMPQGLLNCVFFLNGKTFCLGGGAKHWDLKLSQLVRKLSALMEYPLCNIHTQSTSLRITMVDWSRFVRITKKVHQYGSDDVSNALILDSYISNLPREVKAKDLFHMKPKMKAQKDRHCLGSMQTGWLQHASRNDEEDVNWRETASGIHKS